MSPLSVDFQLNSHLSTLASIHKIYHTLNRLVRLLGIPTMRAIRDQDRSDEDVWITWGVT